MKAKEKSLDDYTIEYCPFCGEKWKHCYCDEFQKKKKNHSRRREKNDW